MLLFFFRVSSLCLSYSLRGGQGWRLTGDGATTGDEVQVKVEERDLNANCGRIRERERERKHLKLNCNLNKTKDEYVYVCVYVCVCLWCPCHLRQLNHKGITRIPLCDMR